MTDHPVSITIAALIAMAAVGLLAYEWVSFFLGGM